MKALVWTGEKKLEVQEKEIPDYTGKVLVKVKYAGICGSDLSVYLGKHPRARTPLTLGHEFSGIIEKIDETIQTDLKPGMHVVIIPTYSCGHCRACLSGNTHVCNSLRLFGTDTDGGMAEYAAVPVENVMQIPDDMPFDIAAVIEPVAVIVHALRMTKNCFYTSVCVTGLGPMGLLTALLLKDSGVSNLIAVEANENRAAYANELGIHTLNPMKDDVNYEVMKMTEGEGVELLVEASGSMQVAKTVTDLTAVRGEILLLSVFKEPAVINLGAINFKEQSVIGTRVYTKLDFADAITYTYRNAEKIRKVVSNVCELSDGADMFAEMTSGHTNTMKVLFSCE